MIYTRFSAKDNGVGGERPEGFRKLEKCILQTNTSGMKLNFCKLARGCLFCKTSIFCTKNEKLVNFL